MSRDIYFSNKTPHLTHEAIYDNDIPFKNSRELKNNTKKVYENNFKGSVQDQLNSLQRITSQIEQSENQFIRKKDTNISASEASSSEKINLISEEDINNYFNQKEKNIFFQNEENILNSNDIDNLFNEKKKGMKKIDDKIFR